MLLLRLTKEITIDLCIEQIASIDLCKGYKTKTADFVSADAMIQRASDTTLHEKRIYAQVANEAGWIVYEFLLDNLIHFNPRITATKAAKVALCKTT